MRRHILTICILLSYACNTFAGDIYVSTNGNDKNAGTKVSPVCTLTKALRIAREWRRTNDERINGGINIHLASGTYQQEETLYLRPEDSGTPTSPTRIIGEGNDNVIISGGKEQTAIPAGKRIVWNKGKKVMRKSAYPQGKMGPILAFDKENETITIPAEALKSFNKGEKLEMIVHQRWAIAILRVKDIQLKGDKAIVSFLNPESRWEFAHPWPQPVIDGERGSSSFTLLSLEDYGSAGTAYTIPALSRLMLIEGSAACRIHDITFEGITFSYTDWQRPTTHGHVTLQGGFPIIEAYKLTENEGTPWAPTLENQAWIERPEAAVTIRWAENINFENCSFTHLASTALDYETACRNISIKHNRFTDIGGTAILCGSFGEGPTEVHHPYIIADEEICSSFDIMHNTITDATNEDWGCVGIGCGYVRNFNIRHNTLSDLNYSGIAIGWGWTPAFTGMKDNVIEHNNVSNYAKQLYDAGGIYTMSYQPGSRIAHNTVSAPCEAPYATNFRAFPIYFDACTDGFTVEHNKLETSKLLKEKYGYNTPGPNMIIEK